MNLTPYPLSLQILMQTDGTVTELIELIMQEPVRVIKLSENIDQQRCLSRQIFLQGKVSGKNWMYATSAIYLDQLPNAFVNGLLQQAIPIGTLWKTYRMETFKELMHQGEESLTEAGLAFGFVAPQEDRLLTRTYCVYHQQQRIMRITEKFPLYLYQ